MSARLVFHRSRVSQESSSGSTRQAEAVRSSVISQVGTEKSKSELDAFLDEEDFDFDVDFHQNEIMGWGGNGAEIIQNIPSVIEEGEENDDENEDDDEDETSNADTEEYEDTENGDSDGSQNSDSESFNSDVAIERAIRAQLFTTPSSTPQRFTMSDSSPSSTKRTRAGRLDKFLAANEQHPNTNTNTNQGRSSSRNPLDDAVSCASNTILSKDVTIISQEMITNMEYMLLRKNREPTGQAKFWPMDQSVKTALTTTKNSAKSLQKRGGSLERDISKTILQTASLGTRGAHFLINAPQSYAPKNEAMVILDDLRSMQESDVVNTKQTTTEITHTNEHEHPTQLHEDEDDKVSIAASYYSRSIIDEVDAIEKSLQATPESKELDDLIRGTTSLQIDADAFNETFDESNSIIDLAETQDKVNQITEKPEAAGQSPTLFETNLSHMLEPAASGDIFEGLIGNTKADLPRTRPLQKISEGDSSVPLEHQRRPPVKNLNTQSARLSNESNGKNSKYDFEPDFGTTELEKIEKDSFHNKARDFIERYYTSQKVHEKLQPSKKDNQAESSSFQPERSQTTKQIDVKFPLVSDASGFPDLAFQERSRPKSDGSGTGDEGDDWTEFDNSVFGSSFLDESTRFSEETPPGHEATKTEQFHSPTSVFNPSDVRATGSDDVEWEEVNRRFVI